MNIVYFKHITAYIEWIYNRRPLGNTALCFMIIKTYLDVSTTRPTAKISWTSLLSVPKKQTPSPPSSVGGSSERIPLNQNNTKIHELLITFTKRSS